MFLFYVIKLNTFIIMVLPHKLICETLDNTPPVEILWEEESLNAPKSLYVQGPYMGAGIVNKNGRFYPIEEMRREMDVFIATKVKKMTATGELNHPQSATLSLKDAAHLITSLYEDNGVWYGKSKVLNGTPNGELLKSLLSNGVAIGMSSRCLGQLVESNEGYSIVQNMKMVTVDAVADPSFGDAWVNGILESRDFVCDIVPTTQIEETYYNFDKALAKLPRGNKNEYIKGAVIEFIKSFRQC